jgi:hypothetical protein
MLFVCSRADTYYWLAGFDVETKRSKRPTKLFEPDTGKCVVFWGSDRSTVTWDNPPPEDPFDWIPKIILGVEKEFVAAGKAGMDYRLNGRFSIVVLPHKTNLPVRRKHAFVSLPERLALAYGRESEPLLADAEFMALDPKS